MKTSDIVFSTLGLLAALLNQLEYNSVIVK